MQVRTQIETLRDNGYVVVRKFAAMETLTSLNAVARQQLVMREMPLEFEADLQYPGAPPTRSAVGGETIRRLLDVYSRDARFASWGTAAPVVEWMREYFGEEALLSRAHHNCLMTKHPLYGSLTGWHRDSRYWSFQREDLVSVWLALGVEEMSNGALWFVPGSNRMHIAAERFDNAKFLKSENAQNEAILQTRDCPRLEPGDAVFFHSNTLHAAGKNLQNQVKFSLVYTYRGRSNPPLPGSRSSSMPEVDLSRRAE